MTKEMNLPTDTQIDMGLLANRVEMIYHTLNEVTESYHVGLITGSDYIAFENLDNNKMTREVDRATLLGLHPVDLVRVVTGLYKDTPCSCDDES
jgi:hypothetical protein